MTYPVGASEGGSDPIPVGVAPGRMRAGDPAVDLSVVLPFRNERDNIPELLKRLAATLGATGLRYELIFIDDGSTDDGVELLEREALTDQRIKILILSRNFGQHVAVTAGIDAARGRLVVWMDSDLQERPEDIPRLIAKHREGFDVVYTVRARRRQAWLRAWLSHWAMRLLNRLARLDVSPDQATMRLFSAQVAQSIRRFRERKRFLGYLMAWAGYRTTKIEIEIDPRPGGRTNYSWVRLVQHALTGLTSFSVAPLRISALLSCTALLGCVVGVGWVVYRYFAYGFGVSGWASLIVVLLVLHAMQFAVLAILGEYVGLTYTEAKRRPVYFCTRTVNLPFPTADMPTMGGTEAWLIPDGTCYHHAEAPRPMRCEGAVLACGTEYSLGLRRPEKPVPQPPAPEDREITTPPCPAGQRKSSV